MLITIVAGVIILDELLCEEDDPLARAGFNIVAKLCRQVGYLCGEGGDRICLRHSAPQAKRT